MAHDKKSKKEKIIKKEMHAFKEGDLHSGKSGKVVKSPKQAIAISLSMARKAGSKIPKKKDS